MYGILDTLENISHHPELTYSRRQYWMKIIQQYFENRTNWF